MSTTPTCRCGNPATVCLDNTHECPKCHEDNLALWSNRISNWPTFEDGRIMTYDEAVTSGKFKIVCPSNPHVS